MSLVKGILRINLGAILFLAGYSFCKYVYSDKRYMIVRANEKPYLVDKVLKRQLPLDEGTFQVGTLEYRICGVINDPDLKVVINKLKMGVATNEIPNR